MKNLMVLLAAFTMFVATAHAENIHPAVEKAMAMEADTPAPTDGETNTTTQPEES